MPDSCLSRRTLLAAIPAAMSLHASRASAEPGWDVQPEIRATETVAAAADLLPGPHYDLGPSVTTIRLSEPLYDHLRRLRALHRAV